MKITKLLQKGTLRSTMMRLAALLVILYGGIIFYLLAPHLGKMRWPVILYILVILVMVWLAFEQWWQVGHLGAGLALIGALLFAISDSALRMPTPEPPPWI